MTRKKKPKKTNIQISNRKYCKTPGRTSSMHPSFNKTNHMCTKYQPWAPKLTSKLPITTYLTSILTSNVLNFCCIIKFDFWTFLFRFSNWFLSYKLVRNNKKITKKKKTILIYGMYICTHEYKHTYTNTQQRTWQNSLRETSVETAAAAKETNNNKIYSWNAFS